MLKKVNHQRINYWLLVAILISYPFSIKVCNALILILVFHWLIWISQNRELFRWNNPMMFLMISSYILCALSLSYTTNLEVGIFALDKKFPLFTLPLVFGTIPTLSKERFELLLIFAVVSVLFAELFCLIMAFTDMSNNPSEGFFWTSLTAPLDNFHPSYLSLYINFLIFCIGYWVIEHWNAIKKNTKWILGGVLVAFYFFLILLASKLQLINLGLITIFLLYKSKGFVRKRVLTGVLMSAVLIISLFIKFSYLGERFLHITTLSYQLDAPPESFNEFTVRLALGKCSWEVIKSNALFGVGAGDVFDELEKVYYEYDYKFGYLDKQNPHNEYLSQILATGVIGLTIFLLTLLLCVREAIKRKDQLYLMFLFLVTSYFLFESVLERNKGIVLFAFFNSFLFFHGKTIHKEKIQETLEL